jgi:hypothetical protein
VTVAMPLSEMPGSDVIESPMFTSAPLSSCMPLSTGRLERTRVNSFT